jgi:hypothetical protein
MGFDLVRGVESRTSKEGAVVVDQDRPSSIWDREVYMHPERLRGSASLKYQKAHDVYSLGVVLLEVGLWEPLANAAAKGGGLSQRDHPDTWPAKLRYLAATPAGLVSRMGRRYQGVVDWCLCNGGDDGIEQTEFVQKVLDPLEEMAHAMS